MSASRPDANHPLYINSLFVTGSNKKRPLPQGARIARVENECSSSSLLEASRDS